MHSGITSKFMLAFEAPFSQGGFCKFDPAAIGRPKRRKGQKVDNDFFGWPGGACKIKGARGVFSKFHNTLNLVKWSEAF